MAHQARGRIPQIVNPPMPGWPMAARLTSGVDRALEHVWHSMLSMRTAALLMLALAALGLVGALVTQAPPEVLQDPRAKAAWIAQVRPTYGGWTDVLDALQLFQVFSSGLFRLIVVALGLSLIACSIRRAPGAWRIVTRPRIDVGRAFFEHAPQRGTLVVRRRPAATLAAVRAVLDDHHYRTLITEDSVIHVYAERFRWSQLAGLVGHLSLVVILAGGVIGATFGYRNDSFTVADGSTRPVAAESGLSLKLVSFTDSYDAATGVPDDYASQVVLYDNGREVTRHTIRVNDPLRYRDVTFYQSFFGSAAVVTVSDAHGQLVSEGVPLAWRSAVDGRPSGAFSIPGTNYVGWVTGTLGSGDTLVQPGQVDLRLFTADGGQPVAERLLDQGSPSQVGDLTVTFDRESQFAGLIVSRDPGVYLVLLGAILLFGGFGLRLLLPHRRLWARIAPGAHGGAVLAMASLRGRDATLGTEFERIVTDIRTALTASAPS
jgi:cytochrome c biogenesis protein